MTKQEFFFTRGILEIPEEWMEPTELSEVILSESLLIGKNYFLCNNFEGEKDEN